MPFAGAQITAPARHFPSEPARPGLRRGPRQPARLRPRLLGRTQRGPALPGKVRQVCPDPQARPGQVRPLLPQVRRGDRLFHPRPARHPHVHLPAGGHRPHELRQILRLHVHRRAPRGATCSPGRAPNWASTGSRSAPGCTRRTPPLWPCWSCCSPSGSGTTCGPTRTTTGGRTGVGRRGEQNPLARRKVWYNRRTAKQNRPRRPACRAGREKPRTMSVCHTFWSDTFTTSPRRRGRIISQRR